MASRPLILLSNDDGHASAGIAAMHAALAGTCDVVMVAPEREQSASSHALSLRKPLRLRTIEPGRHALDGTPADCVYVALHAKTRVLSRWPDAVVSGINHGLNLGQDAFYSGTVAAAREAALRGIPSVATSAHTSLSFERVARTTARITQSMLDRLPKGTSCLLNLNFPKAWTGQIRATRMGTRIYEERVEFRKDPYGQEYLWLGGPGVRHESNPGSDTDAYDAGVASITPLVLDLTCTSLAPLADAIAQDLGTETHT
jgi:5'-nucleotidase